MLKKEQAMLFLRNTKTQSFCSAIVTEMLKNSRKPTSLCYRTITGAVKHNKAEPLFSQPFCLTFDLCPMSLHYPTQRVLSTHQIHYSQLHLLLILFRYFRGISEVEVCSWAGSISKRLAFNISTENWTSISPQKLERYVFEIEPAPQHTASLPTSVRVQRSAPAVQPKTLLYYVGSPFLR